MAEFLISFAVSYVLTRLSQTDGPRLSNLKGFSSDYNSPIPLVFGLENRLTEITCIWATDIVETTHKHKPATDFLFGLVGALLPAQKTFTYSVSFACLVAGNPQSRLVKLWFNKRLVFDAAGSSDVVFTSADGTHSDFDTVRFYPGDFAQMPDPTIEAQEGVGKVPGYRGICYFVIDTLQLANYGNAIPSIVEALVEEAPGDLRRVVGFMCQKAGLELTAVSTTSLDGTVRGYRVDSDVTVADAITPLAEAFNFDVADINGGLRFVPRGRYPVSTITNDQLGGHAAEDDRPEPVRYIRATEVGLPQEVSVGFSDPERDYQPNAQSVRRKGGNAQSNIAFDTTLVLSTDEALTMASKTMWQAWSARQTATAQTDDRRADIVATEVHAFQTPNGLDTYRVTRRTRGQNGVIELQLEADRPLIYNNTLPGVPAPTGAILPVLFTPINTPVFIEPPSSLSGNTPQVWIAVSGGSGVIASGGTTQTAAQNWSGVQIFVATANVEADYRTAGSINAPTYMGVLTQSLDGTSGANPDVVGVLGMDLTMSGGQVASVSAADAASGAINLAYVETAPGSGEFMTFQTAASTEPYIYECTTLYRGLSGSEDTNHAAGAAVVIVDDALARVSLPAELIGIPLWFKFPQPGQALADVTAYLYTPSGGGFGTGTSGVPSTSTGLFGATGGA